MNIAESLKNLSISIIEKIFGALDDFESALEDQIRMYEAQNEIMALTNHEFVTAFNCVARLICNTRADASADTYCSLVKIAVDMLAKGEDEKDVLYYFDKLYVDEKGG